MRFAELELIKFGRFEDCHLRFPRAERDLHIVVGNNEAGKTTTMAAIASLLFTFPHITPYDFRFDKKLLRVGAVLEDHDAELAIRRRSGRVGTLSDREGRPVDDGQLAAMLAGYNLDSFQRMFSLDHQRLRDGGQAILDARDDVGQAIFAAGSGLTGVAGLLARLEEEARQIWGPRRAADRRYYAAERAFEEARGRQKAAQIKPAAWDELRKELERLDQVLDGLRGTRLKVEHSRADVERRRRVLPHAAQLRQVEAELAALGDCRDLPADAAAIQAQVTRELALAEAETRSAGEDRRQILQTLENLVVDQQLIERAGEIEALREEKGAIDKGQADLPRRRAELELLSQRLAELRLELGWPEEDTPALRGRLPRRAALAQLRDLLEQRGALDGILAGARGGETEARKALEQTRAQIERLPPERELGDLQAALKRARDLGDIDTAIAAATRESGRRQQALAAMAAQLDPWRGSADELRRLALPGDDEATAVVADASQAEARVTEARRTLEGLREKQAELELRQAQLLREEKGVTPETLAGVRERRDTAWQAVRAHVLGDRTLEDPRGSADEFERRSAEADGTADRRYFAAEQSARLTDIQQDIERSALALEQAVQALARTEAESAAIADRWLARLSPIGLRLSPQAFGSWAARRRQALQLADELDAAREAHDDLSQRRIAAAARLTNALAAQDVRPPPSADFADLVGIGERLAETAAAESLARRDLLKEAGSAEKGLLRSTERKVAAEGDLARWQEAWTASVAAAGLDAAASPGVIRAQIELIEALRGVVDEHGKLEHRIEAIEGDTQGFADRVAALSARCGLAHDGLSAADALVQLARAAAQAKEIRTRRAEQDAQLASVERRLRDAETARSHAMALLQPLIQIAGVEDAALLADAIARSDRARRLRAERDRLVQEILSAGGGQDLGVLLADITDADPVALGVRGEELQAEIGKLSEQVEQLTHERATVQGSFGRLDGGPDAAIAAADAEQARAEMAVQAEAYMRKRAEVVLLRWTIGRYRAEKQTPLLKRASDLFSRLTLGRYTDLLVDLDGEKARLAGHARDQSVVPVEGMSEGTRDQLYLALRVAAIEDTVAAGARLPFLADDLFINYDDERARAGFEVLAELSTRTQVLFFTHHQHLVDVAKAISPAPDLSVCSLA